MSLALWIAAYFAAMTTAMALVWSSAISCERLGDKRRAWRWTWLGIALGIFHWVWPALLGGAR